MQTCKKHASKQEHASMKAWNHESMQAWKHFDIRGHSFWGRGVGAMPCRGLFILPSRHPVYAHEFGHALGYDSHDMGVIDTFTK